MRFDPFSASPVDFAVCRKSLLCDRLVVPVVPHFNGKNLVLLSKWQEAGEAIANQQVSLASRIYLSDEVQIPASRAEYPVFLFNAAQRLLSLNAQSLADRCVQKGLSLLSSHFQGCPNSFDGSLWLVMASSALNKDDFESCRVWLRQGRQRFLRATANTGRLSPELLRWNGDWCAMEACLQAGTGDREQAESLLSQAHQHHLRARSIDSAAKDLILRSRLRMQGHHWDAAECDLMESQRLIERADSVYDDHCRDELRQIIESDLRAIRVRGDQLEAAHWN